MSDVGELEQRITAALDRIGAGLEIMSSQQGSGTDEAQLQALQDALENEKTANAQLEERVVAIKEKQESLVADLQAQVAKLRNDLAARETDLRNIKQRNHQLRSNNIALREANAQGVGDPDLINAAMVAELDALRASHESDRAELDAILGELQPLVEGGANA